MANTATKDRKWDVSQQEEVVTGQRGKTVKTGESQDVIMNKIYFNNCEDIYEARLLLTCFELQLADSNDWEKWSMTESLE